MSQFIRRSLTTFLNRLVGYVHDIGASVDAADQGNPPSPEGVIQLRRNLHLAMDLIPKIQGKKQEWENYIHNLADGALDQEMQRYDAYQAGGLHFEMFLDNVDELLGQAQILLMEIEAAQTRSRHGSNSTQGSARGRALARREEDNYAKVNMPKLKLPEFHGDVRQWQNFWQMFKASVDDRKMADVQKLNYLIPLIKGKAAEAIQGYGVTSGGYKEVVRVLHERYGDAEIVAKALEADLINMPFAGDSIESLRRTAEGIQRVCRQLVQLGKDEDGGMSLTTAKSKFPSDVITKLVEKELEWKKLPGNEGRSWKMADFRQALNDYINVREEVARCTGAVKAPAAQPKAHQEQWTSRNNRHEAQRNGRRDHAEKATARAFAVVSEPMERPEVRFARKRPPCVFCSGDHWSADCTKVTRREDRIKKLTEFNRCFNCLRRGHVSSDCRIRKKCRNCGGLHHPSICPAPIPKAKAEPSKKRDRRERPSSVPAERTVVAAVGSRTSSKEDQPFLMTKWVDLVPCDGSSRKVLAFMDPGSQISFIKDDLVRELKLPKFKESELDIFPFGKRLPTHLKTTKHLLKIKRADGRMEEVEAYATDNIGSHLAGVITDQPKWSSKSDVRLVDREPDILLGMDVYLRCFRGRKEIAPDRFVVQTTLGDILCGRWQTEAWNHGISRVAMMCMSTTNHDALPDMNQVRDFWALEAIGIQDDPLEDENAAAMEAYRDSIKRENGRYVVGWPWKDKHPELPSNYEMAYSRLAGVLRKLHANPELMRDYDAIIREQLSNGIIEEATRREGELEHFLPHHPVITHKTRIVYDASARPKGSKSLNQCLFRGPVILPDLVGLLMRFRCCKYPVLADLEKAFLQLQLRDQDREVAKFLWLRDPSGPLTKENLVVFRFCRVAFGVISSPFLLGATLQHHLKNYGTELAREMAPDIYVDNVLIQCSTPEEAVRKAKEARAVFSDAKMNLREFVSNAPGFRDALPADLRLDKEEPKVLGVPWHIAQDSLRLAFPRQALQCHTRRTILKTVASVFDPLGLVCPCMLRAKLQFQALWDEEHSWDSALTDKEVDTWTRIEEWVDRAIRIPRRTPVVNDRCSQIHVFVDAAKDAYACAVYVRCEDEGRVHSNLVYAKSRLRPKRMPTLEDEAEGKKRKVITIPRMELMSMVIGVRALKLVANELRLNRVEQYLWGDSKIVLAWINSKEPQPRFVSNRMAEIRTHQNVDFGYVNTADNPADVATRGLTPDELQFKSLWWSGPHWLVKPETEWPTDVRVRVEEMELKEAAPVAVFAAIAPPQEFERIDWSRFGSWTKLVRSFAYVHRFVDHTRKHATENHVTLHSSEIRRARVTVLKLAQKGVVEELKSGLVTVVDPDGIVRLKTRIIHSGAGDEINAPIVLPKKSPVAKLLVLEAHCQLLHAGVDRTLTEFLLRYWTPDARRLVKTTLRSCMRCHKVKGPAYALPTMPALPADRVMRRRAFQSIGVDYLGPTLTKSASGDKAKTWIVIITCLTTRGVYLEPVWDLSGEQFLHVFRRFASLRGRPDRILSDNGTQFRLSAKVLESCATPLCEINWRFIGQLSPWQGGLYERLVALVKEAFRTSLGSSILTYEEVRTFTAEVAASLNCRPLTFVSTEPDGLLPLRPVDFLNPLSELRVEVDIPEDDGEETTPAQRLIAHWKAQTTTQDKFWKRFNRDYLLMLRERAGWTHRGPRSSIQAEPRVGEVVQLEETGKPRNLWPLARVQEL